MKQVKLSNILLGIIAINLTVVSISLVTPKANAQMSSYDASAISKNASPSPPLCK